MVLGFFSVIVWGASFQLLPVPVDGGGFGHTPDESVFFQGDDPVFILNPNLDLGTQFSNLLKESSGITHAMRKGLKAELVDGSRRKEFEAMLNSDQFATHDQAMAILLEVPNHFEGLTPEYESLLKLATKKRIQYVVAGAQPRFSLLAAPFDMRSHIADAIAETLLGMCRDERQILLSLNQVYSFLYQYLSNLDDSEQYKNLMYEISIDLMLSDLKRWEAEIKPHFAWYHQKLLRDRRFYFQTSILYSAMLTTEGQNLANLFFRGGGETRQTEAMVKCLINRTSSCFGLAEYLWTYEITDSLADMILQNADMVSNPRRDEFILERKRLSPMAAEIAKTWLNDRRALQPISVYRRIDDWGITAVSLLPAAIERSESDQDWDLERRGMICKLSAYDNMRSTLKTLDTAFKREVYLGNLSNDLVYRESIAEEFMRVLELKPEQLGVDVTKERALLSQALYYFERHLESLNQEKRESLKTSIKKVFDLPPDRLNEDALVRLLKEWARVDTASVDFYGPMLEELK